MDWTDAVAVLDGKGYILVSLVIGCFASERLPGLIAAFRIVVARNDEPKRARKAPEAIEPSWHWIWQKRG
jgi:hypothetical protein